MMIKDGPKAAVAVGFSGISYDAAF